MGLAPPGQLTSIAVLPFLDETRRTRRDYLSVSAADAAIQALTNVAGLRVSPLASVRVLLGTNAHPRHIGQKLDVRTVLDGSVKTSSNGFQIAAHVINVANGAYLWSTNCDCKSADIPASQSKLLRQVISLLRLSLDEQPLRRLEVNLARNVEAHDLCN